jgi:ectoine hydroxylase-related dioxygenase (phytanoyl-CoA dioxygenase family)
LNIIADFIYYYYIFKGGTAFCHGSHKLSVTAKLTSDDNQQGSASAAATSQKAKDEMHMRIVRPAIELGDAVIFDTRVLHFGLSNLSERTCRPMLYVNMTHSWFNDPKNWDNKQSIFKK